MATPAAATKTPLTIYIVIRKDLVKSFGWKTGSVIAQGCHVTTAVLERFKHESNTQTYLHDLENMHKVVLETKDEQSLKSLAVALEENKVMHHVWIEQPENFPTALATAPIPGRSDVVMAAFKKYCSLYR
ncbi:peptidyl-tRNA hydrolase domain-containing protein 1 [Umbelopsis nana]